MKIGIIILARYGSTRLPGKVLLPIIGKNSIWHIVERARLCFDGEIIIAIPHEDKENEKLTLKKDFLNSVLDICEMNTNVNFYCDLEIKTNDVLGRIYNCARMFNLDIIVDITADCPLIDFSIIKNYISTIGGGIVEYCSNLYPKRFVPDGFDIQIYTFEALKRVHKEIAIDDIYRLHAGWNIGRMIPVEKIYNEYKMNISCINPHLLNLIDESVKWRLTLDTHEDYELIKKIFEHFGHNEFSMMDVICFLDKNRHFLEINSHIKPKKPGE